MNDSTSTNRTESKPAQDSAVPNASLLPPAELERHEYAFKFSWQVETRVAEVVFLLHARKRLPRNIPKVYGYAVVKDTTPVGLFIAYCRTELHKSCDTYEEREIRVLVMDYFEGIEKLEDDELFQDLIYQCMDCKWILGLYGMCAGENLLDLHILYK